MKNTLLVFVVLFCCMFSRHALAQVGNDNKEMWTMLSCHDELKKTIVQVRSQFTELTGGDGGTELFETFGTGVVVGFLSGDPRKPDGYRPALILTACHIVENNLLGNDLTIVFSDGRTSAGSLVLAYRLQFDVAVLLSWIPDDIPTAAVSQNKLERLENFHIMGLGEVDDNFTLESIRNFSAESSYLTGSLWIHSDCYVIPGDSGGPAFNANNEVVGVVSGGFESWRIGKPYIPQWPSRMAAIGPIRDVMDNAAIRYDTHFLKK